MEYEIERTDEEINELLNQCVEARAGETSKFLGMTYEDGLAAAIEWLTEEEPEYGPLD